MLPYKMVSGPIDLGNMDPLFVYRYPFSLLSSRERILSLLRISLSGVCLPEPGTKVGTQYWCVGWKNSYILLLEDIRLLLESHNTHYWNKGTDKFCRNQAFKLRIFKTFITMKQFLLRSPLHGPWRTTLELVLQSSSLVLFATLP